MLIGADMLDKSGRMKSVQSLQSGKFGQLKRAYDEKLAKEETPTIVEEKPEN